MAAVYAKIRAVHSVTRVPVVRHAASGASDDEDAVAVEEPLEIRVAAGGREHAVSVTMRTPGDDYDLAAGFLRTEGLIAGAGDIESIRHWGSPNVVRVALREGVTLDFERLQRHFFASSSCGICGKASIDAVRIHAAPLDDDVRIAADVLASLEPALRARQAAFDSTGAIHAAGAFTRAGALLHAREDVGRHNAVDKCAGALLREGAQADVLFVSGRAGFEVVQKALVARIPIVAAVGAPTSLAVELARETNLTLAGFVREGRFNVYAGEQRVC